MKFIATSALISFLVLFAFSTNIVYGQNCCTSPSDCGGSGFTCDNINTPGSPCPPGQGMCREITPTNPDFSIPFYGFFDIPRLDTIFTAPILTGDATTAIGVFINAALPYIFAIAGLLLFFYLVYGAITMLSGFGNPEKLAAGNTIITRALIGFAIIFISYWLTQILEIIFDITILGT